LDQSPGAEALAEGKTYEPKTFIEHRNWQTQTGS
jgi:hypothetical protein